MNRTFLAIVTSIILVGFGNLAFAQTDKLVVLETELGSIAIEFFPADAPNHVENFITLTESGFYDGTLFHRIIPDFMIQGGDPNTVSGQPGTWGTGGPSEFLDAEFNDIKHNRGIVSMARSQSPNSAGSQFFIVHADSNSLDEDYSVFGRIATQESFETLDKIAGVPTGTQDRPIDPEEVRITKAYTVSRSDISDILEQGQPERTGSSQIVVPDSEVYENAGLGVKFSLPTGWSIQEPPNPQLGTPNLVAIGPQSGSIPPSISLTVTAHNGKTLDDYIEQKNTILQKAQEVGNLVVTNQEKLLNENGAEGYFTDAKGLFAGGDDVATDVRFAEMAIRGPESFYVLAYSSDLDLFEANYDDFVRAVGTFEIMKPEKVVDVMSGYEGDFAAPNQETSTEQDGGCLIATATFGSELAPQVQQLRELRDNTVLSTESGTAFMAGFNQFYYSFSPTIADFERENPAFKEAVKAGITPLLLSLSILNHVDIDSEEQMLSYGIGVIAMNLGMYFIAPAIVIWSIRSHAFRR